MWLSLSPHAAEAAGDRISLHTARPFTTESIDNQETVGVRPATTGGRATPRHRAQRAVSGYGYLDAVR